MRAAHAGSHPRGFSGETPVSADPRQNGQVAGTGRKKSPVERGLEFPSLVQLYAAGGYPALGSDFRI
jgi:hypothetical protein